MSEMHFAPIEGVSISVIVAIDPFVGARIVCLKSTSRMCFQTRWLDKPRHNEICRELHGSFPLSDYGSAEHLAAIKEEGR